jgi:hypothetical protein
MLTSAMEVIIEEFINRVADQVGVEHDMLVPTNVRSFLIELMRESLIHREQTWERVASVALVGDNYYDQAQAMPMVKQYVDEHLYDLLETSAKMSEDDDEERVDFMVRHDVRPVLKKRRLHLINLVEAVSLKRHQIWPFSLEKS